MNHKNQEVLGSISTLNAFSSPLRDRLHELLSEKNGVAVFDADGTLWNDDIGESFFKYQIRHKLAPGLSKVQDPWAHYVNLEQQTAHLAYEWLAQVNAGINETVLRTQAKEFVSAEFKNKPAPQMLDLIKTLHEHKFEVWICTASQKWAVEPMLEIFGVPQNRLVAVEVFVNSTGVLTEEAIRPIPYRLGKRQNLETRLPHRRPHLVAGNSMGDFDMIDLATHLPLVVGFEPQRPSNKDSENTLRAEAKKRNWPIQIFSF
jgi:HAD superfamily phosphoserine phosphatase-like hydrolase